MQLELLTRKDQELDEVLDKQPREVTARRQHMDMQFAFNFKGRELIFKTDKKYEDGTTALVAYYKVNGEMLQWAKMSVAVPEAELAAGEFLIKSWAENEQLFNELVKAKLLIPTGRKIRTGYVEAVVCRLAEGQS